MTQTITHGTHAIIYTDGGYKANIQLGGWGIHGFTYTQEESKQGTGCKVAVITEKGYMPKDYTLKKSDKPITVKSYLNGYGTIAVNATNNTAELMAFNKALNWVAAHPELTHVTFRLDSKYVLEGYQSFLPRWRENGWLKRDGTPVVNQAFWESISATKTILDARENLAFKYEWVKGHSDEYGNETADSHATRGMLAGANGNLDTNYFKESDAKGYWKPRGDRSRFLNQPNWYFASIAGGEGSADNTAVRGETGHTVYYSGFSGKKKGKKDQDVNPINNLGKEIPDARFSICYLKEGDPVMEEIRSAILDMAAGRYRGLMVGDLQTIFDKRRYSEVLTYGADMFMKDYSRLRMLYDTDNIACEEISPARLVYRAIDALNQLEEIFQHHIHKRNVGCVISTDITDLLYEAKSSGKKVDVALKKSISGTLRYLDLPCEYATKAGDIKSAKIRLNLNQDLPDRNTLAALAEEGVKAYVVTWPESPTAIRYATIVENGEGVGIWAGPYSNLMLLKRSA